MTKKLLLIGVLGITALALTYSLSPQKETSYKYSERLSSHMDMDDAVIQGAYEYQRLLKGEFTKEDWERARSFAKSVNQDRSTFNWMDEGPDNVGGRTRAIIVDRDNLNHVFAGSVSGGLFESLNRGNTWQKVDEFSDNLSVSSICQTVDGTFYVATGHQRELSGGSQNAFDTGANGYGIYRSQADGSWTLIEGTENYTYVNEVVCDDINNVIWYASSAGLKKYDPSTDEIENIDEFASFGPCFSVAISKDGNVIVGHSTASGGSTLVSNNGGGSFTEVSAIAETPGVINMTGVGRIEFAISHEKVDGNYRIYASAASGQSGTQGRLKGVWRSADNGNSWARIAPEYDGTPGGFAPFQTGAGTFQGLYDNIITVVPGAPDKMLLGGINCYSWSTTGNWTQISMSFLHPTNPLYVHADNHEFHWDETGRLYIGNDGGVSVSDNGGASTPTFYPANRGYNVTQFYATGVSAHGDVIGGTQDNGTKANYHEGTTYQEHKTVNGSDGFSSHISFINRDLLFSSVFYSAVSRSSDRGGNNSAFVPPFFSSPGSPCTVGGASGLGSCGQFFTNFEMWEHPNDLASKDSVRYVAGRDYEIGESIDIPSAVSNTFIPYITDINIVFDDTVDFDPELTTEDIVVEDLLSDDEFNLGVLEWEFIFGGPDISIGDSLRIFGVEVTDTVIVEDFTTINHYFGTNPLKPGKVIDMGNDVQVFDIAWDTLTIQDPYQSWFALDMGSGDNGGGLWMTRNALRFSATSQGWFKVRDSIPGTGISSMEYSKNGEYLFIGTFDGHLFRYTGFNDAYSPTELIEGPTIAGVTYDTLIDHLGDKHVTEFSEIEVIPGISPITGIASGPIDDPEYLVITLGNYASPVGKVRECTNAATGINPTFTTITGFPGSGPGAAIPGIPCYSVIVDRDDINTIVVGTEFGVFATEDGGEIWNNISGDFGSAPVYDMQQNWRKWEEGCKRPGEIYIGTHGRGIWSSDALLSTPEENDNLAKDKFEPKITLYPNPLRDNGTVNFYLDQQDNVSLQIFNLNGQLVEQVQASNLQAGKNQILFNAELLEAGTYILRLNANTFTETTKFIKR